MKKLLIGILFLGITLFSVACATPSEDTSTSSNGGTVYTITFRQEGAADVLFEVEEGGSFEEALPVCVQKTGYTAKWENADYTDIGEDMLIMAVYTPNAYVITYESGLTAENESRYGYTIEGNAQSVVFDGQVTLYVPTAGELGFLGWKIKGTKDFFTDGKYEVAENITLVAVWDREWSDRV